MDNRETLRDIDHSQDPLVSVMITSYNQKDIIWRAIESVLGQTFQNIQIVIADDSSTDGSQELLKEFSRKYPNKIKLVLSSFNQGIARNKNNGFRNCDGEFITYLDGDDYYFPGKIARELEALYLNPQADIVYSNFVYVDGDGKLIKIWKDESHTVPVGNIFEYVYARRFPHENLFRCELMKAKLLQEMGFYDESLKTHEDWDLRIRMSKKFYFAYSDYIGSAYVNNPCGISKILERKKLIENIKLVIQKNKHLLKDLPFNKRISILRNLEIIATRKELAVKTAPFTIELLKYLLISGDLMFLKNHLKRYLKKD